MFTELIYLNKNNNRNKNTNETDWINSHPKNNIMQGCTYHKYYLKINIFLFWKINFICIKKYRWIKIISWKIKHKQSNLGCVVCFLKSGFRETTFQTFLCLFVIRKVDQQKTLSYQRKIWLDFQESVFLLFGRKTLSRSCEKFKNIILFTDYVKFGP